MQIEVKLFKKQGTYVKDGKDKQFTNYYLKLNDSMIPIEVKYFPNDKFGGRDPGYQGRVAALNLVAELLPDIPSSGKSQNINPRQIACPKCGKVMRVNDQDDSVYYLFCDDCGIGSVFNTKVGDLVFTDPEGNEIPF